ncbi:aminoacyl-tRNA hydrolase [Buchnera aphidicola (Taiwanaphis decaspermi)]|uniref:aminoacyl-tRNA hydrolase n=1 Tax=Buchnera aphidicola TaxID=9 RepID=UPI0031B7FEE7
MKMIVGLANPGKKYKNNRHNVGSWMINLLSTYYNVFLKKNDYFLSYTSIIKNKNNKIKIVVPNTYINLSGHPVSLIKSFYKIKSKNIFVVHDDMNLDIGIIKITYGNKYGGHNGIKNILEKINNKKIYRLRIGIGRQKKNESIKSFVLNNPNYKEKKKILKGIKLGLIFFKLLLKFDINKAMHFLKRRKK